MKTRTILVFNCGSSSLKFSFFCMESSIIDDATIEKSPTETTLNTVECHEISDLKTLLYGEVAMGQKNLSHFYVMNGANQTLVDEQTLLDKNAGAINYIDATHHILCTLERLSTLLPEVIAHRIVHGGMHLRQHCFINNEVMRQLEASSAFAPLHNQIALKVINVTQQAYPQLPQVLCFDTAFHATMPQVAATLPISKHLQNMGIQRYGFHGLSCESVLAQCNKPLPEKSIIAHLGNGASVTAIKNGQSVDTSMGFTPSGGVMMGSRSGDIDPGVLIYLMREKNVDLAAIDQLINHQSGLMGVSGISSDMRILHQSAQTNADAALAIDLFCYSVAKQIAAMASVLNGLDMLVFTGGIGENDALIRSAICQKLTFLGVRLDAIKNQANAAKNTVNTMSDESSSVAVLVIASNENAQIARHAYALLSDAAH